MKIIFKNRSWRILLIYEKRQA